ncbi:GerAB/ArcD/ProY family transporter [Clostridium thermarum]|uniref:GerAB/ArcD/ProY family transporter n=1 Tax=Clostridium thermarum TaxID=1716543 RepID=UPI0013CFC028|nr:endospore germination permease [Clostridium thermarum]
MNDNNKISILQLKLLLMGFCFGSTLIANPAVKAYKDAWIANILGGLAGLLLVIMYSYISMLNPSKNLVAILRDTFGRKLGALISAAYIWYFTHLAALVLRNFGAFIASVTYTETPMLFSMFCFFVIVLYVLIKGIENLSRMAEFFVPIQIAIIIIVTIALMSISNIRNLLPVFERGFRPVITTAFSITTFPYGEVVAFLVLYPLLNDQKMILKSSITSVIFVCFILTSIAIRNISVLGVELAIRAVFPSHVTYRLVPKIDADPLLDLALQIGGIVKLGVCMYSALYCIMELFRLETYKFLILPLGGCILSLSMLLYENALEMLAWASDIWPYYSIPFQIVIPIVILIRSIILNKSNKTVHPDS